MTKSNKIEDKLLPSVASMFMSVSIVSIKAYESFQPEIYVEAESMQIWIDYGLDKQIFVGQVLDDPSYSIHHYQP